MTEPSPTPAVVEIPSWLADLKPREQRFVIEYHVDYDAKAAAIRAGYKEGSDRAWFNALKRRLEPAITRYGTDCLADINIEARRIIEEMAMIAFHNPLDFFRRDTRGNLELKSPEELGEKARCIQGVERSIDAKGTETLKIKFYPKDAMLERLGKVIGMYKDVGGFGPTLNVQINTGGGESPTPQIITVERA